MDIKEKLTGMRKAMKANDDVSRRTTRMTRSHQTGRSGKQTGAGRLGRDGAPAEGDQEPPGGHRGGRKATGKN